MVFRTLKGPTSAQWELTANCNYKCFHCYNYWRSCGNVPEHFDYCVVAEQLIENNVFQVTLTGGEPLLVYDEIKPHIEKMIAAGINISINTNAALLTQEMVDFFLVNHIGLLISLPCAIPEINDKITTVKGSFDKTVAGIKLAKRNNLPFAVNMVVTKINNNRVIETARFLRDELGVNSISVGRASRPINGVSGFDKYALTLEEFRGMLEDLIFIRDNLGMRVSTLSVYAECSCDSNETYEIFADRKCFAGKTTLAIGYNGDVKACARDSVAYGNLANKTLKECWDAMDDWRTFDVESLPKECHECNARYSCQGGCRLDRNNSIPGKIYRDETKLPISFEVNREDVPEYEGEDVFVVRKDVKYYEEDFGMKGVNCYKDAFFVTNMLHEFLITNSEFTMKSFMDYFEVSCEEANYALLYLVRHNAIKSMY